MGLKALYQAWKQPKKAKTPQIQLKKAGGEDPRDPRLAIEFLMNQMRLYAKRYVSMCPAQLKSKDHTNVSFSRSSKISKNLPNKAR